MGNLGLFCSKRTTLHKASEILTWARETINTEANAIQQLIQQLNNDFAEVVSLILERKGRVVITGIGKSAAIANKIVATLNSTGTPAMFMHAADAVHGDLGMIQSDDTIICISKSGNTPEIKVLAPLLKSSGNPLIAMVGDANSFLASHADYILDVTVSKEACPNNLAPTTSTTAQLVMGDALAVCLLKARGFTSKDFAKYHPGGALGKRLYTTVKDIAKQNQKPMVMTNADIREIIIELTGKRLGAVAVMENKVLVGIITDGDIRRMLEKHSNVDGLMAEDIMSPSPKTIDENELATQASRLMSENNITQVISTRKGEYAGMIHIHDLNREGIL